MHELGLNEGCRKRWWSSWEVQKQGLGLRVLLEAWEGIFGGQCGAELLMQEPSGCMLWG